MKKSALLFAAGLAAGVLPTLALADDGLAYNIGAVSDYRYRGISQSKLDPALQGGIDWTKGPFYLGTWASTIKWINDTAKAAGGSGHAGAEWDLYGGYRGEIVKDVSYDVGALAYVYIDGRNAFHPIGLADPDTGEFYGSVSYGVYTAKVSVSATNLFGIPNSKGSQYYDLSANYDLGSGFSLSPDLAYQNITGHFYQDQGLPDPSYLEYSLTLGKDFGKGLSASLAFVGTDAHKADYQTSNGKFTGRNGAVVGVKYTF